jgi:hypothetical protein
MSYTLDVGTVFGVILCGGCLIVGAIRELKK